MSLKALNLKKNNIDNFEAKQIYLIEEVFQKFGFDYKNFQLHVKDKNPITTKIKKVKASKKKIMSNTLSDKEVETLYPMLDFTLLPQGIKTMLKGFTEGYTYYQLMCLVLYF